MSRHVIEYECECRSCKGTGVYVGMAERDGFAVVCYQCKGTGKRHETIEYDDFDGRKDRPGVCRVVEVNPGIALGVNDKLTLDSFGGVPYEDWKAGKPFPPGSEMRAFTCPAWWYQSAKYELKPDWDWCIYSGSFTACEHFPTREKCWERFDQEQAAKAATVR